MNTTCRCELGTSWALVVLLVVVGGILQLVGIGWCLPFVGLRGLVPGVLSEEHRVGNQPTAIPATGILRTLLEPNRIGERKGSKKHVSTALAGTRKGTAAG